MRPLLEAAHIRGVAQKGSDDCRNGLILCKNHHSAFDTNLIIFQPETERLSFVTASLLTSWE